MHPRSSWTTVRDEEHDILAGRYLNAGEMIQAGMRLHIDVFEILVLDSLQVSSGGEEQIEIVDLTTSEHQITRPNPRIGGRFWVLVDDEEEEVEDRHSVAAKDPKETPSDVICEAFSPGYSEEEVATLVDDIVRAMIRRGLGCIPRIRWRLFAGVFTRGRRRLRSGLGKGLYLRLFSEPRR
ncbi:uncharacterized protein LOC119348177 [Triticum dicoccoides]|uniref:uncharacterized protein LOC119348177 n=1 Tax=Triticum dicoccoides TaxID=85692 RepID=UPI00188F4E8A|nr:uncharacterized protein LOC119348177 [Triticum dicoccoides]